MERVGPLEPYLMWSELDHKSLILVVALDLLWIYKQVLRMSMYLIQATIALLLCKALIVFVFSLSLY